MWNGGLSEDAVVGAVRADPGSISSSTLICAREMGLPARIVSAVEAELEAARSGRVAVPTNCPEVVDALRTSSTQAVVRAIESGGRQYSSDTTVCAEEMGAPPEVLAAMRGSARARGDNVLRLSTPAGDDDWLQSTSAARPPAEESRAAAPREAAPATSAALEITPPSVMRQVAPQFPEAARELRGDAVCMVFFTVDTSGSPTDIMVRGCPEVLHQSVRDAGMKWRFEPARQDGRPVEGRLALRVRFRR